MSNAQPAEGLVGGSDSDEEVEKPSEGPAKSGAMDMDALRAVLDDVREALSTEKAAGRDKDVQLHKLRAERDIVVEEHRRLANKEAASVKLELEREREANRALESQLQDVLGLWESAANEARSESASELAQLRAELEAANLRVGEVEASKALGEQKMRAEMDQIMKLWDEAQQTSGAEILELQERVRELRAQLQQAQAERRRAEAREDSYV